MERAGGLEKSLDEELKELEEEIGCVYCIILDLVTYLRDSLKLQVVRLELHWVLRKRVGMPEVNT